MTVTSLIDGTVYIAETAEPGSALGFYALVLGDRTVQFLEHGEGLIEMPLAAFWRMVAELEGAGFRDGRRMRPLPPVKPRERKSRPRSPVRDAVRAWVAERNGARFHCRDVSEGAGVPLGSVGKYLRELVADGVIESRLGRDGGYQRRRPAASDDAEGVTESAPAACSEEGM